MRNPKLNYRVLLPAILLVLVLIGAGVLFFLDLRTKYLFLQENASKIVESVDYAIRYDQLTHWEREEWSPETFFDSPELIDACERISSRDVGRIQEWIDEGGNPNSTGKYGVTLLFWAMLDRNHPAFSQLLMNGSDPNIAFTEDIARMNDRFVFLGDNVMFASVEFREFQFLLTALTYSDNPDQRDQSGGNLFTRLSQPRFLFSIRSYEAVTMIRAGVDPNYHSAERGHSAPASSFLIFNRADVAFAMILAGADPAVGSDSVDSVIDVVRSRRKSDHYIINDPDFCRLEKWLMTNGYLGKNWNSLNKSTDSVLTE